MSETLNLGNGNWATKEDSLLAYNSENGNFKPLPFDFTRASSATVVNKAGLIETVGNDIPRIDYTDSTEGALLLENSATNKIIYSQDFTKSDWTTSGSIIKEGNTSDILALDGTQSVGKLTFNGTGFLSEGFISIPSGSSSTYTLSFYLKGTVGETLSSYMDSVAGTYVFNSSDILLTGEWQRVSYSINTLANNVGINIVIRKQSSETVNTVYIYGAQLEQGSYATSYIPTQGGAVTRVADACGGTGNANVFNSVNNSGVLYFKMKRNAQSGIIASYLSISDGTSNNYVSLYTYLNGNLDIDMSVGGVPQYSERNPILVTWTDLNKIAIRWKANELTFWVNGVSNTVTSIGTGLVFSSSILSILNLGFFNGGSKNYSDYSEIKVLTYQTDEEMVALTTI